MATTVSTLGSPPLLSLQEEQPRIEKRRPEYMFVHTVRFWSMVAIVLMHSAAKFGKYQSVSMAEYSVLIQPFKFGTIAFFMISGFLVGDRLPSSDPLGYLRRRANRLIPAWLIWYGLQVVLTWQRDLIANRGPGLNGKLALSLLSTDSIKGLTDTALWFVPNFMVALTCVVLLRKWLNSLRLGAALLCVSLFYGVNVYTHWIPSRHTEAVFGFVFYLWLGAWCALRKERVQSWAAALSPWWLSFGAALGAALSLIEVRLLAAQNSPDYFNSLRFGNQIYSVLIVILLMRIRRRSWPAFINVAETTYGVYLIHGIIISLVFAVAMKIVRVPGHVLGPAGVALMWVVLAPTAYLLSLQLTRTFASSSRWCWVVGAAKSGAHLRQTSPVAATESIAQTEQGLINA